MNPQTPPAVVLDTNVALDWLLFENPRVLALASAVQAGAVRWIATPPMRQELAYMLSHHSLAHWPRDPARALTVFDAQAALCDIAPPSRLHCSDPDDQMFIDLALAEAADWLVTHDRALLKLARRAWVRGLRVTTPMAWRLHAATV